MAEKKIYQHHERDSEAGAISDIQTREIVFSSDIDYLLYETAASTVRYVFTMSEDAISESAGVVTFSNMVIVAGALVAGTSLDINASTVVTGVLDQDSMADDSNEKLCTQQSIKAYVDAQVDTADTWAEILAGGNTSGATDVIIDAGQSLTVDTNTLVVNASGYTDKVGINIAAPTEALEVMGDVLAKNTGTTTVKCYHGTTGGQLELQGGNAKAYVWETSTKDLSLGAGNAEGISISGSDQAVGMAAALTVTGLITANGGITIPTTKNLVMVSDSDILVNTDKFTVAGTTGNTAIAGTLDVTGVTTVTGAAVLQSTLTVATSLDIGSSVVVTGVLDQDSMADDSNEKLCTQQSIKAYVDAQVATADTWAEVLANGNTSGANDVTISGNQKLYFNDTNSYIGDPVPNGVIGLVISDTTRINISSDEVYIGDGSTADILSVYSGSSNGQFKWESVADYFQFYDDILMRTTEKIYFRDTALSIHSDADTFIDYTADGAHRFAGAVTMDNSLVVDTNTLVVNASGYADKVGINILAPTEALEVTGNILAKNAGTTTVKCYHGSTGGQLELQGGLTKAYVWETSTKDLSIGAGNVEGISISGSDQAVSMVAALTVGGKLTVTEDILAQNIGTTTIQCYHGSTGGQLELQGGLTKAYVWETSTKDLSLGAGNVEGISISGTDQSVGIGVSAADSLLEVAGTLHIQGEADFDDQININDVGSSSPVTMNLATNVFTINSPSGSISLTSPSVTTDGPLTVGTDLTVTGNDINDAAGAWLTSDGAGGLKTESGIVSFGTAFNSAVAFNFTHQSTALSGTTQIGMQIDANFGTAATAQSIGLDLYHDTAVTGTVSIAKGLQIHNLARSGSATVNNQYGLYIDDLSGATTNYAIYTEGAGLVYFGDDTEVADGQAFTVDTNTLVVNASGYTDKVGIGTATPDGTLHVHTATAGAVPVAAGADDLIVENNTDCGISILAPNSASSSINFCSPTDPVGAVITWVHDTDSMTIGTQNPGGTLTFTVADGQNALTIDAAKDATFAGDINVTGSINVGSVYHAYGGFQGESETIEVATQNVYVPITNAGTNLFTQLEGDGITLTNDVWTIVNAGDYFGTLSLTISGSTGKDFHVRMYNITQAAVVGYYMGSTTTGATNIQCVTLPLYIEAAANDTFRFEMTCTSDASDPIVESAVYYINFLHD